ncbi:MAG TPA: hypothetical protein VH092_23750, partial [Urbifossiella sp.]|nr:hypothetical protein [Urbifossiella sp.]
MRVFDIVGGGAVRALAFAPGGQSLVASVTFRGALVHDLTGARLPLWVALRDFPGRPVLGFEPGGALAAVTAHGRALFDPVTGAFLGLSPNDEDAPGGVESFAASADGTRLVTSRSVFNLTRLTGWVSADPWDRRWTVDIGPSSHLAVSAAGDRVAVLAWPHDNPRGGIRLQLRDAATGELVATGGYPHQEFGQPQFRPDGIQVVVPYMATLVVWDTRMPGKPAVVRNDGRQHFTAA